MRTVVIMMAVLLCAVGCSRKVYVPVESVSVRVRADTLLAERVRTDSVILRDSVIVSQRGDTVVKEVWRVRERLSRAGAERVRISRDTVAEYISVPVEVEKRVEVPRELTRWQRARMNVGSGVMWLLAAIVIILVIKIIKRRKL